MLSFARGMNEMNGTQIIISNLTRKQDSRIKFWYLLLAAAGLLWQMTLDVRAKGYDKSATRRCERT